MEENDSKLKDIPRYNSLKEFSRNDDGNPKKSLEIKVDPQLLIPYAEHCESNGEYQGDLYKVKKVAITIYPIAIIPNISNETSLYFAFLTDPEMDEAYIRRFISLGDIE